jgi:hypothetical protein
MTDNEVKSAPLAQPEPADLSGVSWPDPGPITARAVFADGECYLLDTQPGPEGPTAAELRNLWSVCNSPSVFARAVIAADRARWGRPAIQPVAVAEPEDPTGNQAMTRALIAVSGGLCYFTADAKHAQLLTVQKILLEALRPEPDAMYLRHGSAMNG